MPSLTDDLLSQLSGSATSQIAERLGIDAQQAGGAISAALPLLLGKLGSNASLPDGAQALLGALQNNHSGMDLGGVLGAVLGGESGAASNGAGILGHIFGSQQEHAMAGVARSTGLQSGQASQLLQMLAPLVMAFLGNRSGGSNADALSGLLGQEQRALRQQDGGGLLGALLDQDGDGELGLGDLLKVGMGALGGKR